MNKNLTEQIEIAQNPNTPGSQLVELAAQPIDEEVLALIARNPNSPPNLLVKL